MTEIHHVKYCHEECYNLEFILANIQNSNIEVAVDSNNKIDKWTATFQMKLLNFVN